MQKVRARVVVIGCVLVTTGLVLIVVGHGRIQPGFGNESASQLDYLTSTAAPGGTSERDTGSLTMGIGALLVLAGIGLCAASRPGGDGGVPPE
jgi:hypothetical protein